MTGMQDWSRKDGSDPVFCLADPAYQLFAGPALQLAAFPGPRHGQVGCTSSLQSLLIRRNSERCHENSGFAADGKKSKKIIK